MAIPVQNVRFAGPPGHAGQQHARQPTDGAGSAGVRGAHRRCAQTAEASELVHGSAHIRGVRQRREGAVACVLALCLIGLPMAVRTQNCPHDYIAWPREQCTQRCPAAFKCSYDASRTVTRYQADYCCLCVSDGQGNYEAFMCAGSAKPRPAGRQVPCRAPADHSRRGKQGRRWTDKGCVCGAGALQRDNQRPAASGDGARAIRRRRADVLCALIRGPAPELGAGPLHVSRSGGRKILHSQRSSTFTR